MRHSEERDSPEPGCARPDLTALTYEEPECWAQGSAEPGHEEPEDAEPGRAEPAYDSPRAASPARRLRKGADAAAPCAQAAVVLRPFL